MQSAQLTQVTKFKYLGSTWQSDDDTSTEINSVDGTTEGYIRRPIYDKRVPTHVKGNIHNDRSASYVVGIETVSVAGSHVKKLEVTEMKMCRWACGRTLIDHVRNEDIKERLKVGPREYHREVQEIATEVVFPRKEARPRLRRKIDSGGGTTREKKARKTEAEMDGLCQPRHESYRNDERRGP